MAVSTSDLKVNRDLLDVNFDGYKLCLDVMPIYTSTLDTDIDNPKLPNDLYSYQHLKVFGVTNKLYADPWNDNVVYFIDCQWRIQSCRLESNLTYVLTSKIHLTMEDADERKKSKEQRVAPSLYFANEEWLVVSDGAGRLFIVNTGVRNDDREWKIRYQNDIIGDDKYFIVLHSATHNHDKQMFIEVLCLHVDKNTSQDDCTSTFDTIIHWLTFTSSDGTHFELSRSRSLQGKNGPDYAAIVVDGSSGDVLKDGHGDNNGGVGGCNDADHCKIVIISEKQFEFVDDSLKQIESRKPSEANLKSAEISEVAAEESTQPTYTWTQKGKEITVYIKLTEDTKKEDISCIIQTDHVYLKSNAANNIMFGSQLVGKVNVSECTWTISDKSLLEIHLEKVDGELTWEEVFVGERGQLVFDDEQIAIINEKLAPFTSDNIEGDEKSQKTNFNIGQLEECDEVDTDSYRIVCYHGDTHKIIHQIDLSNNQWLFMSPNVSTNVPLICVRHDVDGLVFQFNQSTTTNQPGTPTWKHIATFNAFGYVQASKQQRKFTICPPDFSYVAVVDCVKHVFLYKQPSMLVSPLKNRKTGENLDKIAKQYLISLDNNDDIYGAVATNKHLFILSGQSLHCVRITND